MSKVNVKPLYEGTFSVGLDKNFRRINREDPPNKGALKLSVNPFLIQDGEKNILFDVGLGDLLGENTSIDTILENLADEGIEDFEITDIFASHLHFDHIGGLANRKNGYWELTFPDATIWISKNGWEKLRESLDKVSDDEKDFFNFIDSHANLSFLDDDEKRVGHVRTKKIGGHTEFHRVLFYENGEDRYIMAGDVLGRRSAINRSFEAKFDFDPKQSLKVRNELQELAYEENYAIMTYHESDYPIFRLTDYNEKKGYKIENLS
ncbi:MBL fold metallo-hydrolase [Rhodohalobacter sp.]|uniref:MBL fold metallo-hydrolase n=1 Tax=Rhodohalobacter sp. TaxID=1974210 RepID=UPI002ACD29B5|nr:MBL fold metallo-hydrolase [Rhodohalobacter sp.]MDZ7757931.1 MBL fold metallo-hydrolase [Rhodohalobacter sp.]